MRLLVGRVFTGGIDARPPCAAGQSDGERDAGGVGDQVVLAARPAPVDLDAGRSPVTRRRHSLLSGALRAAAYAIGACTVGLAFWLIQQRLQS